MRAALDHEDVGPLRNLTASVERSGVCLIPIVGLEGVAGLSSWVDGVPVIGITPSMPGDRFRFTICYELGHLRFHTTRSDMAENEANRFAGALLFPRAEFDAVMSERPVLKHFIALKATWGMAVSALVYRAHELGHLDRVAQVSAGRVRR